MRWIRDTTGRGQEVAFVIGPELPKVLNEGIYSKSSYRGSEYDLGYIA